MDHETALREQAAERYALGEMEREERDRFEEHYFDCVVCAGDVRVSSAFVANIRDVFRKDAPVTRQIVEPKRRSWFVMWRPSLAFAAVAFCSLCLVAYESLIVMPQLRSPRAMQAAVLKGESRGEATIIPASADQPLLLTMDVNAAAPKGKCLIEIARGTQGTVLTFEAEAPNPGEPLDIYLPPGELQPGTYVLTVRSEDRSKSELGRYSFELRHA